jgi:hypothetical protein
VRQTDQAPNQVLLQLEKMMSEEVARFKIMLDYLLEGKVIEHDGFRYGMDDNHEIGFVATKNGVDCLIGDRLSFGQAYTLAQKLPKDLIVCITGTNAIIKVKNESRRTH